MIENLPPSRQDILCRNWFILIYEESVKQDYQDILRDMGIRCAISPIHQYDLLKTGELQKPHRHLLLTFKGGRDLKTIDTIIESINAYKHCQVTFDCQAAFDYLTHKNETNKYKYDVKDIIFINSTIYDFVNKSFKDILNFIDDYEILSLKRLTIELRKQNLDRLLEYVSNNAYYVSNYIKECREDKEKELLEQIGYVKQLIANYENEGLTSNKHLERIKKMYDKK